MTLRLKNIHIIITIICVQKNNQLLLIQKFDYQIQDFDKTRLYLKTLTELRYLLKKINMNFDNQKIHTYFKKWE